MDTLEELFDLTKTSKYGNDIDAEIKAEVFLTMLTPMGSVPYYREFGSELKKQESRPNTISQLIKLQISTIKSLQRYNSDLTSAKERRIYLIPDSLEFDASNKANGEMSAIFEYVPLKDVDMQSKESVII